MVLDFIAHNVKVGRYLLRQYIFSLDGERCAKPWLLIGGLTEINNAVDVISIMFVAMERAQVVFPYFVNIYKTINCATHARLGVSS